MDLARAPRRRPLTARKKGSGYENETTTELAFMIEGHDVNSFREQLCMLACVFMSLQNIGLPN
jgi:hypothetical protein